MKYPSGDAELFYEEQGGGPTVVLLHPTPVDHRFWLPLAGMLSVRFRVLMPDLRGHGQSELGAGPITMEKLGADIERLLDEAGVERAMFAGCSVGGYTLYELWRRCPRRVQALAFMGSKPQADTKDARARRQANIEKIQSGGRSEFIEAMLNSLIGETARSRWPQKRSEAREMMETVRSEALVAIQQGLAARPDSVATAKTISVPSCVIAAGEDPAAKVADMRLLADALLEGGGETEFHEIPDAGHFAPWEQPETVGRILREFFNEAR